MIEYDRGTWRNELGQIIHGQEVARPLPERWKRRLVRKSVIKYLLIIGGSLSLTLGCIGIFLPLLPTTPFLLLSAYCYLRGSPALYDWLLGQKTLGSYLNNYLTYRAISKKAKIVALAFLWLSLIIGICSAPRFGLKLLLAAVGLGVSIHLFTLRTLTATNRDEYPLQAEPEKSIEQPSKIC